MKFRLCFFFLLATGTLSAQYYFNDLVSIQISNDQYKLLRTQKIRKISATSFEADNTPTEGFALEENISMDGKRITLSTTTSGGNASVTNRFYELGKLKKTQSAGRNIENKTDYSYTDKGWIQKIVLTTIDTAMKSTLTEVHEWTYTETGLPASMLKIKNRTDTTLVELVRDEQGNVVEERWKKKNSVLETYYYYYDAAKRLTDIVRYNIRLKKLMPDFQYEYDSNGRTTQMIQFSWNSSSYIIWKYTYNEKGLKKEETGYDKEKKTIGRIVYSYE